MIQDTVIASRYTLVYPNPNKGEFWVEFHETNTDYAPHRKIYVLDIDGKIILELSTSDLKNKIELTQVTAGSYFVVIYDGQKTESHQITVMK